MLGCCASKNLNLINLYQQIYIVTVEYCNSVKFKKNDKR